MFLSTHFLLVNNVRYSLPSNTLKKPYYIYFLPPYLFPSPCSRYNGTCQSCIGSLRKLNLNFRMAGLRQIILTKNKFSLAIQPVPTSVDILLDLTRSTEILSWKKFIEQVESSKIQKLQSLDLLEFLWLCFEPVPRSIVIFMRRLSIWSYLSLNCLSFASTGASCTSKANISFSFFSVQCIKDLYQV